MRSIKVAFRVDASREIGSGHIMRCLALAEELRRRGAECRFICREHPGHMTGPIGARGFKVLLLPAPSADAPEELCPNAHARWLGCSQALDAANTIDSLAGWNPDWLVVDHYALDERWERELRPACSRILVIDDLADRRHDCDLLLDQNLWQDGAARHHGLIGPGCGLLLGARFALLQPEYAELHPASPPREGPIGRLLVYFGAADLHGMTGRVIAAIRTLDAPDLRVDVVTGAAEAQWSAVAGQVAGDARFTLHRAVASLAGLMLRADAAVGAAGTTSWERCCLGLPALVVTIAENQREVAAELHRRGLVRWLGHHDEVDPATLCAAIAGMLDAQQTAVWSESCLAEVDGAGAARVAGLLMLDRDAVLVPRRARLADEALLLEWANDPVVRSQSFDSRAIGDTEHRRWFRGRLRDVDGCRIFIVEASDGLPVGQVRFDLVDCEWRIDYSIDPRCRGRGLGPPLLAAAVGAMKAARLSGPLLASVKDGNVASLRVLRALGFREEPAGGGVVLFRSAVGGHDG